MPEPLSPEAYAAAGGSTCPVCGNRLLRCEMDWEHSGWLFLVQDVDCDACKSSWKTIYELTGYEDLTIPLPEKEK